MSKKKTTKKKPSVPAMRSTCIAWILEVMYPENDADHEWDSGTLNDVAQALQECGFGPHAK